LADFIVSPSTLTSKAGGLEGPGREQGQKEREIRKTVEGSVDRNKNEHKYKQEIGTEQTR